MSLAAGLALALVASPPVVAQGTPTLAAYWDFNDSSNPNRTLDKLYRFEGLLEGGAFFSTGRTGAPGDNAIDFGFTSASQLVRINEVPFLNLAASQDQITISFWQINGPAVHTSSAFWGVSPSSSSGFRGIQAHTPWSDGNIYFDTAGCCDAATQRISGNVTTQYPGFTAGNEWFHVVFLKNGATKQVWINGTLLFEGSNTSPLPTDFTSLVLGAEPSGGNSMQGAMDDFAVFAGALSVESIGLLAAGTAPDQLPGVPVLTGPLIGGAIGNPIGFEVEITETAANPVNTSSVVVQFDGAPVTVTANKVGNLTTVTYSNPAVLLPAGSSHEVNLAFKDTGGADYSAVRTFVVGPYVAVPPEFALPTGSGTAGQPGFVWNMHQNEALQGTTVQRALDQLAGRLIDPAFSQPYANNADPAVQGVSPAPATPANPAWAPIRFDIPTVINLSQMGGENNGNFPNDGQMPGIPGTTTSTDGIAAEVLTYIEFTQAGVYVMGVNSDDGFRTRVAPRNPQDAIGLALGEFNAGRGAADTLFTLHIGQPGVYAFKTVWFEGGGGANIEWFTVLDNGTKVLLNDTANGGLPTFRSAAGAGVYVASTIPGAGATGVRPDTVIEVQLRDDGGQTIDQASIKLMLDGVTLTPTISKVDTLTTVRAALSGLLAPASIHEVEVEFAATGGSVLTGAWTFSVANYPTVPPSLGSMPGSGIAAQPGINGLIYQVEPPSDYTATDGATTGLGEGRIMDTQTENAESILAGLYGANVARLTDPNYPSANGIYQLDVINFNQDVGPIGNFGPDEPIPGIPGNSTVVDTDNIAGAFTAYAEFTQAGYYAMGVNSDDGFRVTVAETVPRQYVQVEAPASIAGPIASTPTANGIDGAAFGGAVPTIPIVAEAVLAVGDAGSPTCPPFANAEALVGKIALIDRGVCPFADKARAVQAAGAVAAIIINDRPQFPFTMGGAAADITIPCVMIMQQDGQSLKDNLNGLVMSLGSDSGFFLGQFSGGRGASDTLFGFAIPTPGVYPLRCLWFEGGGGANVEWFTITAAGERILLNDRANPRAIQTYRAWNYQALPSEDHAITVARDGADIVLTFEGTLQSADTINGSWDDVSGATSPHRVTPAGAAKLYRSWR